MVGSSFFTFKSYDEKKGKHVRSITLFGGSLRTAQRTDMMKKREACALHIRHSFWQVFQNCTTRKKRGAPAFFSISRHHIFLWWAFHNAREKKEGTRIFLSFLPERTQKKLNMIAREFEFVVGRVY